MFNFFPLISLLFALLTGGVSHSMPKIWQKVNDQWVELKPVQEIRKDKQGRFALSFQLNFGFVPTSQNRSLMVALGSNFGTQTYSPITISGSGTFTKANDNCSGNTVGIGNTCTLEFKYSPTAKSTETGAGFVPISEVDPNGNIFSGSVTFNLLGNSKDIPPLECKVAGSIVGIDGRTLGEWVPVVGTNLNLHYTSRFAPEYVDGSFSLSPGFSFNFEGWTNSLHHFYDYNQQRLFLGTGEVIYKDARMLSSGNYMVVSDDGDEVYIFTPAGQHLETKTGLMGALKYSFGYDGNARLVTITDAYSNVTTFTRNGTTGKTTSITAPYGQVTTIAFNGQGLISSITNPNSEIYSMTYKVIPQTPPTPDIYTGLLATFTKPGGQVTTLTYDSSGKLTKDLGNGGNFWDLVESSGTITRSSQMNRSTVYGTSYDSDGDYGRILTEPSGLVTTQAQYVGEGSSSSNSIQTSSQNATDDERFGVVHRRNVDSTVTISSTASTTYFWQSVAYLGGVTPDAFNFSSLTKTRHRSGHEIVEVYTSSTKEKVITSEEGATAKITYNSNEKPVAIQVGSDTSTTIAYDSNGRLSSTIQGSNNQKTYAYNVAGFLQSVTNALSEVTSYVYDLAGRLTTVTLPDSRVIQYAYDSNGNLTGVTPPSRPIHNFTFNAFELPAEYQPPTLSGVSVVNTQYSYNMDKQLTQITRPTGATATFNYNSTTGLLSNITLAGGTNSYTYRTNTDLVSRIDSADGIRSNYTYYGYDLNTEEQRKTSTDFLVGKVARNFDWIHRQNAIYVQGNSSSPSFTIVSTLNGDDKPTQIGGMALTYSYPSGRLSTTTHDKISDSRTYDTYGNISGYSAHYNPTSGSPVLLYSYTLTRDTLHRITAKTETIGGVTDTYSYSYDNSGRLTTVLKNSAAYSSYTYDSNGNRTSGASAGASFTATFDNQDRQLTYGALTFTHNANGDRTERVIPGTGTNEYTWDALGNLKTMKLTSGSTVNFGYDGRNRLVVRDVAGSVTYRNIYEDDYRIKARATNAGVLTQVYQYGTRINTPDAFYNGSWYRFITDHLGSPRLVVRVTDGVVGQRIDYNDLGRVTYDSAAGFQAYGFAGGIYLPTEGLVKFGARMYDPIVGRWLSKDPILFDGGDTNLYGYVENDPVNFVDPSGLIRNPRSIFDEALRHPNSSSGTSGPENALQHCFASCMMAAENGSATAAALGAGFEFINNLRGQSSGDYCMDSHNNKAGRDIAKENGISNLTGFSESSHRGVSSSCSQACSGANSSGRLVNLGGR